MLFIILIIFLFVNYYYPNEIIFSLKMEWMKLITLDVVLFRSNGRSFDSLHSFFFLVSSLFFLPFERSKIKLDWRLEIPLVRGWDEELTLTAPPCKGDSRKSIPNTGRWLRYDFEPSLFFCFTQRSPSSLSISSI